jgi:hypothetical protein
MYVDKAMTQLDDQLPEFADSDTLVELDNADYHLAKALENLDAEIGVRITVGRSAVGQKPQRA